MIKDLEILSWAIFDLVPNFFEGTFIIWLSFDIKESMLGLVKCANENKKHIVLEIWLCVLIALTFFADKQNFFKKDIGWFQESKPV